MKFVQCREWFRSLRSLNHSVRPPPQSFGEDAPASITIWFWILALFQIELFKSLMRPFQLFSTIVCLSKLKSIIPLKVGKRNALRGKKWNYWLLSQCWKIVQKCRIWFFVIKNSFFKEQQLILVTFLKNETFQRLFKQCVQPSPRVAIHVENALKNTNDSSLQLWTQ